MSKLTATEVRGMMEAYNAVYAPQQEEQEVQELALEIIENAAYVLFSQGYDVEDVISYFTEATEEVISEDFVNFAEGNLIIESVAVSDEYIAEQFEVLNEILGRLAQGAIKLGSKVFGAGAGAMRGGAGAKGALGAMVKSASRSASQTLGRATTAAKGLMSKAGGALGKVGGALSKIPGAKLAGKVVGRAAPGVGAALYGMDAVNRAKRGDWGGAALSGLGAGLSLAPGVGTLASLAPAGVQMATDALGLTGDKSKKAPSAKVAPPKPQKALGGQTSFKAGGGQAALAKGKSMTDIQKAGSQALYKAGGGDAAMKPGTTRAQVIAKGVQATPSLKSKPAPAPAKPAPAAAAPEVKATNTIAAKPSQPPVAPAKPKTEPAPKPAGQSKMSQDAAELRDMQKASQMRQQGQDVTGANITSVRKDVEKFNKPEELNKPAPAGTALAAEQERRRKAAEAAAQTKPQPVNASYEYDAYDLVLEYLFSEGHVDTVDEAHYVMLEMDSNTIQDIVEAKYGTAAGRKALAKKIRKGENIGKKGPGTGFKAVAKAAEKGGAEDPEAVAAAAMYKTYDGKKGKTQKEY